MYQQLYKQIIDRAKQQKRQKGQGDYYEWHHIVPEFMFKKRKRKGPHGHLDGDPNHPDNLVLLTFQEHLMCHYYLYEMHKDTKYGYQAGSALQFFFTKAGGNHQRQIHLSEVDQEFLNKMAHVRELGISSISNARKGKMPVVDAVSRQSMGSVPVDHPKVLSGEWIHHSKGIRGHKNGKSQEGAQNNNYKGITHDQLMRVMKCVPLAVVDGIYLQKAAMVRVLKTELKEFKKLSHVWINNHLGGLHAVVDRYNQLNGSDYKYDPYYRSVAQRELARLANKSKTLKTNAQGRTS